MKIAYYSYDHMKNPNCGGGGSYRDYMINSVLAKSHEIHSFYGTYKGCKPISEGNLHTTFLGIPFSYLLSRITYTMVATVHALFVKADIIVICFSIFSPVFSFVLRRNKSVIELFHLANREPLRKYSIIGILPWLFEKAVLVSSKNIICINTGVERFIANRYKKKNIQTIFTGFDHELLSTTPIDNHFILSLGRIDIHMKGLDLLCDAFEQIAPDFPDLKLIFAGRGSSRDIQWLQKRISAMPMASRVEFRQNIGNNEKVDLLSSCSIACMPSRFEGWGIAAIEAAACAKATVGTQITGLNEAIIDGKTGLLIPSKSVNELACAISRLLGDSQLRMRLGQNGRERAKKFTWEALAQQHETLYKAIANNITLNH